MSPIFESRLPRLASISSLALAGALLTACGGGGGSADAGTTTSNSGTSSGTTSSTGSGSSTDAGTGTSTDTSTGTGTNTGTTDTTDTSGTASTGDTTTATATDITSNTPDGLADPAAIATAAAEQLEQPLSVAAAATTAAAPVLIYVSPTGNDSWTGASSTVNTANSNGPVKTVQQAQVLARAKLYAMTTGKASRATVRVEILPGTYDMTTPLQFMETDSGTAAAPVVYEAVTPGTVILSGGKTLTQTSTSTSRAVFAVPSTSVDWSAAQQLYVNGRRAVLARQPNAGNNYYVTSAVTLPSETGVNIGTSAFKTSDDALAWVSNLSAADRATAVVNMYQSWTTGRHRLASAPSGALQVAPAAKWPFLSVGTSQRYYVENVKAALDAPGEFFGEASGVTYLRRSDETTAALQAIMPMTESVIVVKANAAKNIYVQYLQLRGLRIENTRFLTPAGGYLDGQAASGVDAAIMVDSASNLLIDNCRFAHTGGYGVWLRANVRNSTVAHNIMSDLGAGGVKIGQAVQSPTDTTATGADTVTANIITDDGHLMPGAVAIWVGQSFDNTISQNAVGNTTYAGISAGWTWGYGTATAGNNAITNNLLFNIGLGVLSDFGAIYTVGVQPGTTVSGNVIREVRGYTGYGPSNSSGAWGIYQDQGTSNTDTENNVVIGTDNGGFHQNFGRSNTVQNNLFAWGTTAEFRLTVSDPSNTRLATTGNLFMPVSVQPFAVMAKSPDVIYSADFVSLTKSGATPDLSMCGSGCTLDNATLATTSSPAGIALTGGPAAIASMVASTVSNAGPAGYALATANLVSASPPVVKLAPPAPYTLDIANTAIGSTPLGMRYAFGINPTSIQTVAMAGAASTGKCLQFTDSSTNANKYEPYAVSVLNYTTGTVTTTFQLWVDANTYFMHEWRDSAVPYNIGPTFTISAAGVMNSKFKVIAPVTMNAWTTYTVTAPIGNTSGTFTLKVTDANGVSNTVTNIANGSTAFKSLQNMVFISDANVSTTACLGSLSVTN